MYFLIDALTTLPPYINGSATAIHAIRLFIVRQDTVETRRTHSLSASYGTNPDIHLILVHLFPHRPPLCFPSYASCSVDPKAYLRLILIRLSVRSPIPPAQGQFAGQHAVDVDGFPPSSLFRRAALALILLSSLRRNLIILQLRPFTSSSRHFRDSAHYHYERTLTSENLLSNNLVDF